MREFIGRASELAVLDKRLERVRTSAGGVALAIRGRRQVGKSRLVQEFCDRAGAPYLYFTATKGASPVEAITALVDELRESTLVSDPEVVPSLDTGKWPDAFRMLAGALPDRPSVVVLDEVPWLAEQDDIFDGALQTAWDRLLSQRPVLLLLLGSDLHMMERFTAYDRPMYGRADQLLLGPLNPAETGTALGLTGADALDAHLITGGLPGILQAWPHGMTALDFLRTECVDPASPLFVVPETTLAAELPSPDTARRVLEAVGTGGRTHANIAAASGGREGALPSGTLSPILRRLVEEKRILAVDAPLSTRPGKPTLYRVADSNLRLYLAVLRAAHEQAQRGRPQVGFRMIERQWSTWRGRAMEPLVREALELAAGGGELPWPDTEVIGGWWNRQFNPELDLVGADRSPVADRISFVGSIKWLASPFDRHDLAALERGAAQVPGADPARTGLAVVSLSGWAGDAPPDGVGLAWSADEVLAAWTATPAARNEQ